MKPLIIAVIIGAAYSSLSRAESEVDLLGLPIEELLQIQITAQKREQQWYEVPLSVDVYQGHSLRDKNIHHFRELSHLAPGLVYGRVGDTPNIYLRGIGSDLVSAGADGSTAVYLDDVYLARPEMAVAQFWDLERIEILKGPQGTLYGRNATSGAINIIRTPASFDRADGYARLNTGSVSLRQLESAYGTPLGDALAIRGSLFASKDSGYTKDLDPRGGDTADDTDAVGARVEVRWKLSEQLETSLAADTYRDNSHGFTVKPLDNKGLAQQLGAQPVPQFHSTRNNEPSYNDYKTEGVTWHWTWRFDAVELHSISAYRTLDANYSYNTDGSEIYVSDSQLHWTQEQRTQELRLESADHGQWRWQLGASWLDETPTQDAGRVRYLQNNSVVIYSQAETTAKDIYGEIEWIFHPQWRAKLGLRSSSEDRQNNNQSLNTRDVMGLNSDFELASAPVAGTPVNKSFHHLSPQVVVSFAPDTIIGHSLWYLSATHGFKSGGINSLADNQSFKPEHITSYEAGYKRDYNTLVWQLALFHYDYRDLQVTTFLNGNTITNAATANIDGIDASVLWEMDHHWQWQMGVTALDAHYGTFFTALPGLAAPYDVSGNPMPYAPQWDFNQELIYLHKLQSGELQLSLQHHWQSKTYFNQFADTTVSQPTTQVFDLIALWSIDEHWQMGAKIINLGDKNYFSNIARLPSISIASAPEGSAVGVTAPGRQFLFEINYSF